MFCQKCGAEIDDGLTFCTNCGEKQIDVKSEAVNQSENSSTNSYEASIGLESPMNVSFVEAIKLFFINYVNFTGRSTKSEYWWAYLFNLIVSMVVSGIPYVGQIVALGLLLPGLAVAVRRLHDTGKSWTYMFMGLIPIAGVIILIIQYCKDSDADNQWGPAARN